MSYLPFLAKGRGGAFAVGPGAPSGAAAPSEQDVLDLNPLWWLDAAAANVYKDAGNTVMDPATDDATNVQEWHDKTSNGVEFKEGTVDSQPAWKVSGENGMPYVTFDSGARVYVPKAAVSNYETPMTMYMVMATHTSVTQQVNFCQGKYHIKFYDNAYENAMQTSFGADNTVNWGTQTPAPQSLTTQILQFEFAGDALPVLRINGGSAATRATSAAATTHDWAIAGTTNMFWGVWTAKFNSYDYLAIGDVTHDADVVLGHLGDKYGIDVEAVS